MKESSLYINFFSKYRYIIFVPVILVFTISMFYEIQKPKTFEYQSVFEYQYNPAMVQEDVILAEQLVGNLRDKYGTVAVENGTETAVNLNFYRSTPLTINFVASSKEPNSAKLVFRRISAELKESYPLTLVVEERQNTKSSFNLLEVLAAFVGSLFIMIFFTSLFDYFRQH